MERCNQKKLSLSGLVGVVCLMSAGGVKGMSFDDIRQIYIVPISCEDSTKDIKDREWKVLLGRETRSCCGADTPWDLLHIPFNQLFSFGRMRSWIGGKFKFDQQRIDEYAYLALAKLTNNKLTRESSLYYSYAFGRNAKIEKLVCIQPKGYEQALVFFIPTEYVSASALNPGKTDLDMTLQWLDAKELSTKREDVEEETTRFFDLHWDAADAKKMFAKLKTLEEENTAHVIATLVQKSGPKYRWDQLNNTVAVSAVDFSELSLSKGKFKAKDRDKDTEYNSPQQYYDAQKMCKGTPQFIMDCQIKNLFVANFYKFKNADVNKKAVADLADAELKGKVLVYQDTDLIIGVGDSAKRGLNQQGRMLMFFRDTNLRTFANDEKGAELAYDHYKRDPRYAIATLVKNNTSNLLWRFYVTARAGINQLFKRR
jgi:hypothetical protein